MNKNDPVYFIEVNSPVGRLTLTSDDHYLTGLYFSQNEVALKGAVRRKTEILKKTESQLKAYFAGQLKSFNLAMKIDGTGFQVSVWNELKKIKMGELRSYSEHAIELKKSKAVRAVGSAIGKNPIGIIIPCHRVIAKSGGLGGFGGGLKAKKWLLNHEGHREIRGDQND